MASVIEWSPLALEDLHAEANQIARVSTTYAAAFVADVFAGADVLAEWPKAGHVVPELGTPWIRELPVRNRRLVHEVTDEGNELILALVHGARDLAALWRRRGD